MGTIEVPNDRYYGAQTQRSLHHFAISGERMAPELTRALAQVKRASAYVNHALGLLDAAKTTAIVAAAVVLPALALPHKLGLLVAAGVGIVCGLLLARFDRGAK